MNALEQRMLVLVGEKVRARAEIVADLEVLENRLKAEKQSPEDWIRLAELQSQPKDASSPEKGTV